MKRTREDGRSKPRELKPSVKRLIVHRAITQRQVPREFLANELIKEINEAREIPPTLETAKRYISKARNTHNPIDEPWTLACCSEYVSFFPPESIPLIIHYKESLSQIDTAIDYQKFFGNSISDISIRCAIWATRLKPIIDHLSPKLMVENEPLPSTFPLFIAMLYSMAEMSSEILSEDHFDSSDLDNALFSGDLRTFMTFAVMKPRATVRPCIHNGNCELCDHVKIPGSGGLCIPKRKEVSK